MAWAFITTPRPLYAPSIDTVHIESERKLWLQNQTAEGLRTAATSPTALLSGRTKRSFCSWFNDLRTRLLLLHHSVTTLSAVPSFRFLRQVLVFVTQSPVLYTSLSLYTSPQLYLWNHIIYQALLRFQASDAK